MSTERLTDPFELSGLEEPMAAIEYKQLLLEQHVLWTEGKTTISSVGKLADPRAVQIESRLEELWLLLSKENKEHMFQLSEMLLSEVLGPSKEAQARQDEINSSEEGSD